MGREKNKMFIIASALTLGLGIFTPFSANASIQTTEMTIQVEELIKGTVIDMWREGMTIKAEDGKRYHVGLQLFSDEQFEAMNISPGSVVQVEGKTLESFSDFYTFDVYKKGLPKGVTEEEIKKLETLFNEMKQLEKEEKWEESSVIWQEIDKIVNPYYLAEWEPEPFETYIGWYEYDFSSEDLIKMERLYNESMTLIKSGDSEVADKKMEEFYSIISDYYVPPTFDEYLAGSNITLSEADYPVIKKLYDEATEAGQAENYELSGEKWQELDKLMRPYYRAAYPPPTFEEQMSYYDFEVSEQDLAKLKEIYAAIIALEDMYNDEEAFQHWEAFNKIMEPYFKLNESIPFRASQVVINGETFN